MISLDAHTVARALGGSVAGYNVVAPGPGHSRSDRSPSIRIEPEAPDGFILYSFAGDPPLVCRDYVRAALGLGKWVKRHEQYAPRGSAHAVVSHNHNDDVRKRSAFASHLWNEARDPRGTLVELYLASRGLTLQNDIAGKVIRFHPALKINGTQVGGMIALMRDVLTNEPCGVHRTLLDITGGPLLDSNGRKIRRMLGRAGGAAIKLSADEDVSARPRHCRRRGGWVVGFALWLEAGVGRGN